MTLLTPKSTVEGLRWPGLPDAHGQALLSLLYQFEQSQWWSFEELQARQFAQLEALLRHAVETVPFYARRLAEAGVDGKRPLNPEVWSQLPLLYRRDVQESFADLQSTRFPRAHGKTNQVFTSGSTATPIKVVKTDLSQLYWSALTLRDHQWHGRDLSRKLAAIRPTSSKQASFPDGLHSRAWGPAVAAVFPSGPATLLDIGSKVHDQATWLEHQDPDYLLSYPSNLQVLAHFCQEKGIRLPRLRQVLSMSELLYPEVRAACDAAWDVPVKDMYSTEETGYIAFQCPDHDHYHIQSEDVMVEILDDSGRPCAQRHVGQLVVTPLHNFAMPLLRYVVGDLGEAGEACDCGRGLPVLRRVIGRIRGMVRLPNGEEHYANYAGMLEGLDAVVQFQVVRRAEEELEIKLVASRTLDDAEADTLRERLRDRFKYPFKVTVTYYEEIPRGPGGKFQDFVP